MASSIPVPSYPSASHHFLKRMYATDAVQEIAEPKELRIAIIGAGIGGLSAAVALKTAGFPVTVYEQASAVSEIGAGIQVPPNSARLLHSWGLEEQLCKKSVKPHSIIWRRWANGVEVGHTRLNPQFQEWYGAPYYVIHRAHLHEVLHEQAKALGVGIELNASVVKYDVDEGSFTLQNGVSVETDLIIAADGLRSTARQALMGDEYTPPTPSGLAAFRATVPVDEMRANPKTAWIAESGSLNMWVGHNTHAMTYAIAEGRLYNMVLTHPEPNQPCDWDQSSALADMKAKYTGWDPTLLALLDMVKHTQKWPIQSIKIPKSWSDRRGKLVLLGDAAHAMLPNMALGAAMAVEDAAALAECLKAYPQKDTLREAIDLYERVRVPRAEATHEASVLQGQTIHYADGALQQARDAAMRAQVDNVHFVDSPDQWSDPMTQIYCYGYDVREEVAEELERGRSCTGKTKNGS